MKFLDLIYLALALTATHVNGTCFTSGIEEETVFASTVVSAVSVIVSNPTGIRLYRQVSQHANYSREFVVGGFAASTRKGACRAYLDGTSYRHYNFYIENKYGWWRPLVHADCIIFLSREIACKRGGDRTYD